MCWRHAHLSFIDVSLLLPRARVQPGLLVGALRHLQAGRGEATPPCRLTGGCHYGLEDQGSLWMPATGNSPLLGQQVCWPRSELKPCLGVVLSRGSHIDSAHLSWVKTVGSGVHSFLHRLPAVVPGASSWTSLCLSIFLHRMGCSQYFLCRLT